MKHQETSLTYSATRLNCSPEEKQLWSDQKMTKISFLFFFLAKFKNAKTLQKESQEFVQYLYLKEKNTQSWNTTQYQLRKRFHGCYHSVNRQHLLPIQPHFQGLCGVTGQHMYMFIPSCNLCMAYFRFSYFLPVFCKTSVHWQLTLLVGH